MRERIIRIEPDDLLALLTHYSDGEIPPDSELREFGHSQYMHRLLGLLVRSGNWPSDLATTASGDVYPYHFRYEGRKTMSWNGPRHSDLPVWTDSLEAPDRQ
jgi:hypothetical protein